MVKKNPNEEAERYMNNAKQFLSEKGMKKDGYYQDPKYVKIAGHAAWTGVLYAVDATLKVKEKIGKSNRPNYKNYVEAISKANSKILPVFSTAYLGLHQSMSYDAILNINIIQEYLQAGERVIDWCAENYMQN